MEPQRSEPPTERLGLRILSGLVLAVAVLAAVWAGTPYFELLVGAFAVVMAWEWVSLTGRGARHIGWMLVGVVYVAVPCLAILWLRADAMGLEMVLAVLFAVWATDIGAYALGRFIGGPKLAPKISPGKTWAGALGGLAGALAVGAISAYIVPQWTIGPTLALAVVISVAAQLGDLWESWVKRRFGAKDSGSVIPGHGGVLDRVDGLMIAVPVAAAIVLAGQGGGT